MIPIRTEVVFRDQGKQKASLNWIHFNIQPANLG